MSKKIAFVFPGQGSQAVGMVTKLAEDFETVSITFSEASKILGYDLWEICANGPVSELNRTEITQPALLTASIALWRIWKELSEVRPVLLAGHSLGEYSALVAAEAISFTKAVELVQARGRYMQAAVAPGVGAMAAILGLPRAEIESICKEINKDDNIVSAVNFNNQLQTVIAGNKAAVEEAMQKLKDAGAKRVIVLPVSVPSHCSLMKPAAKRLQEHLERLTISKPKIPVIHNFDVCGHDGAADICDALVQQLANPVRWVETIELFAAQGIEHVIECGPGSVLTSMSKRIVNNVEFTSINDLETLEQAQALVA